MTMIHSYDGLPDPGAEAAFYEGVPVKRLIAWVIDVAAIALLTLVLVPLTAFTALFYLPLLYAVTGFLYRWTTLARGSATPGMRLAAIEIRRGDGGPLDAQTAFLHVAGYTVSIAFFPLQLFSIALMLITPRAQGLTDHLIGTAAVRRAARV